MGIQSIGNSKTGMITTNAAVGRQDNQDSSKAGVQASGPQPPSFSNSASGCLFGRQ